MSQYQSVVFFDLDGTLMVNPFETAVWPVVLGEIAVASGLETAAIAERIIAENIARQDDASVAPTLAMDWDDIARTVAARLGVRLESNCEALVRQHAASHSALLDGALDMLRDLDAPHRALVVATKGLSKYQQPVLDALRLTALFDDILTPDCHHALKKHAAFFGTWPGQTRLQIMVGDRYDDDVVGPGAHGFKTVWIPGNLSPLLLRKDPFARALLYEYPARGRATADAIIDSLAELPAVVRRLEMSVLGFSD